MSLSSSKQSSSSQLDPELKAQYLANLESVKGVAGGLEARQFAGFTPDQMASFNISRQFADPNSRQMQQLGDAATMAQNAGNYNPLNVNAQNINAAQLNRGSIRDVATQGVTGQQVTQEALGAIAPQARANIRDVNAGSFLNQNIPAYMNPFNQAVTQQGLTELERSRQLEQQNTAAKATAARAFGGSRQGVAEAETNRSYGDLAQKFIAQQNAAGFESARTSAEADLARQTKAQELNQLQDAATTKQSLELAGQFGLANQEAQLRAQLANQGVDLSTGQLNTQNTQQAALANAQNFLQANLANQQAGLQANQQRIGAGGLLSNIAGQGQAMGFAGANQLAAQGGMQQGFSQAQLDAIRNLPLEQQQLINQALGLNVGGGSGMQSSSSGSSFGASVIK